MEKIKMSYIKNWEGDGDYLEAVQKAVKDGLGEFKSDPRYRGILEHVSLSEFNGCCGLLRDKNISDELLEKFKENDTIGGGEKRERELFKGSIGTGTVKYMAIAHQIKELVKNKKNIKVLEIGGGYGGQIKILSDLIDISEVYMVDIPIVLELQEKYLSHHAIQITKICPDEVQPWYDFKFDLVISNHAICELHHDLQDTYLPLVRNSESGYILYHDIDSWGGSYSMDEFTEKIDKKYNGGRYHDSPIIEW